MAAAYAPSNRYQESPVSVQSEWSDINSYTTRTRPDMGYGAMPPFHRGDSATPPGQGAMNYPPSHRPMNSFGPPSLDPSQRRRPSEAGSRGSSRNGSYAHSRSSDGTISDVQSKKYKRMEMQLQQHYVVLRAFLRGGPPPQARPSKAKDKLLRLSPVQFHELSTDVFDELQRRQASAPLAGRAPRNVPPHLLPRPDFHEKRNQARQKLSSLATSRFRDLSMDVFYELERRFPNFANPDARRDSERSQSRGPPSRAGYSGAGVPSEYNGHPPGPRTRSQAGSTANGPMGPVRTDSTDSEDTYGDKEYGRPMPKQFQSSTILPTKSTMVEDEDEAQGVDSRYDRSSDAFGLESALASPGSNYDRSATSHSLSGLHKTTKSNESSKEDWANVRQDLEKKLEDAEQLNHKLQDELDRIQSDQANMERDLRAQIEATQNIGSRDVMLKDRHAELEREHQRLQQRFAEQRKITEEVSKQGEQWLNEMRAMAEGGGSLEVEEKLHHDVQRLEEEVKEWKARYAKARTQLRHVRTSTVGLPGPDVARQARDGAFYAEDGLIKDIHITKFQIAIDELLRSARAEDSMTVQEHVPAVVKAVQGITQDLDQSKNTGKDADVTRRQLKLKSKLSATANNLITASQNFAMGGGLSPVSLLDASASHLANAVVDLVRTVKITPTPAGELSHEDDNNLGPMPSNGYFDVAERLRASSRQDSEYSALSTPNGPIDQADGGYASYDVENDYAMVSRGGLGIRTEPINREDDAKLEDLKIYLEDQVVNMTETVGSLVDCIRRNESMPALHTHISHVLNILNTVVSTVQIGWEDQSSFQTDLKARASPMISNLAQSKDELLRANNEAQSHAGKPSEREFMKTLPPLAFRIARDTQELLHAIDAMGRGEGEGEDFS